MISQKSWDDYNKAFKQGLKDDEKVILKCISNSLKTFWGKERAKNLIERHEEAITINEKRRY